MRTSLLLLLLVFTATVVQDSIRADERPMNLLVIETDEHHYGTLGCYGGKIVGTPHIDWIAEHGAKCTSFYATSPVCSPSRAALMSGLYPHRTPVTTNNIPLDDDIVTFAELLRRRGYATGYAGKWHLDGNGKPQWAPERKFGFEDNRFMFNRGHWKKFEDGPDGPRIGARNPRGQPTYDLNGADEKTFSTDWLTDKAIGFVEEHADEPFCYVLNLPDPHGPNTVRAPYDTMYDGVEVPIPVSLKRSPDQIPAWGQPAGVTAAQLRRLMRNYWGMVKCIDDNVGRLIAMLREKGLLERTIIVFTSDHGDLCGEHGRLNKGVPYEGSSRIPFLIHAPGKVPAGLVVNEALSNVDFLPTVMSLLDVPVEHSVDGRNATVLFSKDRDGEWDDVAFLRSAGVPDAANGWLSAVTARYKLVVSTNETPWLIDLENDPNELTNVMGRPEHRDVGRRLASKLADYAKRHDDPYARLPRMRAWLEQLTSAR